MVFPGSCDDQFATRHCSEATFPPCDLDAGCQALDVPFPGSGERLIEVVDIKDQLTFRRGEPAEVRQVRIAAQLHMQPVLGKVARSDAMIAAAPR